MKQFYIYVQCRPTGEPFYVGCSGYAGRVYRLCGRSQHYRNIIAKYGACNILTYTYNCESENQAKVYEVWMIAYGRAQGWRLCNQTDGGEGTSGITPSTKTRASVAAANRRRVWAAESRKKLGAAHVGNTYAVGCVQSAQQRLANSKRMLGKQYALGSTNRSRTGQTWKVSDETKAKHVAWWASPAGQRRKLQMKKHTKEK